jgi:nucleotide-binding universal stress UspA family protein
MRGRPPSRPPEHTGVVRSSAGLPSRAVQPTVRHTLACHMFSKIVVPLDGSPASNAALPLARTMARAGGASVTLLRVGRHDEHQDEVAPSLQRIRDELAGSDIEVHALVREGEPADEILDAVRSLGADLIIMRTHGRSGVGRAVLGSVTDRVVAHSRVPVLLLRAGGRRISELRRVLVPLDGSPGGVVALGAALRLARASRAAVHLVQVVVPVPNYLYGGAAGFEGLTYIDPAWDDEAVAAARSYLAGMAQRLQDVEVSYDAFVAAAVPDAIVERADEESADLIIMSTHALTGPARALLGSVTDAVVRAANCPVLVIRTAEVSASAPP